MHQDSDDEANDDDDEKVSIKKESSGRSPSPPAEDSEPEMTEEEKEFQLVSLIIQMILFCIKTVVVEQTVFEKNILEIMNILSSFR